MQKATDNDDSSDNCLKFGKTLNVFYCYGQMILVVTSSAAVERVFSILHNMFEDQEQNSLQDYIAISTMSRYNNQKSKTKNHCVTLHMIHICIVQYTTIRGYCTMNNMCILRIIILKNNR